MRHRDPKRLRFHRDYPNLKPRGIVDRFISRGGMSAGYVNGGVGNFAGGGPAVSLLTGLKAYYALSDATDALGQNNLTNVNGTTFVAGKVGNAASFASASSQSLTHGDVPGLRSGGVFTIACWIQLTTKTTEQSFVSKYANGGPTSEFVLFYNNSTDRISLNGVTTGGGGEDSLAASSFGSPTAATWYFAAAGYNGTNLFISVNAGTQNTVAHASQNSGSALFSLGNATGVGPLNGLVDELGYWGRVLTPSEITRLFNGGNGTTYPFTGI